MTEVADSTQPAMCYPGEEQYEIWKQRATELGYDSVSQFMIEMVEAGYLQFNATFEFDKDYSELREQRNDLKRQLDHARERIAELENQLYRGEREAIVKFIKQQSEGADYAEIVQHIVDDAPARVAETLEAMEGDELTAEDGTYVISGGNDDRR